MGQRTVRRVQVKVVDEVTDLICNQCGASHALGNHDSPLMNNIHLFTAGGGFGTEFPGDMEQVEFALCATCLKALVDGFKVKAPVTGGMWSQDYKAMHTEHDLEEWVISGGWAHPHGSSPWPAGTPQTKEESRARQALAMQREEDYSRLCDEGLGWPNHKLYRHFKSSGGSDHLYEIVEVYVFDLETHEPLVVYRALYGDSAMYVRPLAMWDDHVERETYSGPRFQPVGELK